MSPLSSLIRSIHASLFSGRHQIHVFAALCIIGCTSQAAPLGTYFWGGGSGSLDTTTANWSVTGSAPYTMTFGESGPPVNAAFYEATAGTISFTMDYTGGFLIDAPDYIFLLNGHTLDSSEANFFNYSATFDFASGASSLVAGTGSAIAIGGTGMTITNYSLGSDSIRFGTSAGALTSGQLSLIIFTGYSMGGAAQIDSSGYVTPQGTLLSIPEPSSCAFISGALILGASLIRRRRKAA
jgi:hypothetical protein